MEGGIGVGDIMEEEPTGRLWKDLESYVPFVDVYDDFICLCIAGPFQTMLDIFEGKNRMVVVSL